MTMTMMVPMKSLLLGLVLRTQSSLVQAFFSSCSSNNIISPLAFANSIVSSSKTSSLTSTSALDMARNRGLERRDEGATPLRKLHFESHIRLRVFGAWFACYLMMYV